MKIIKILLNLAIVAALLAFGCGQGGEKLTTKSKEAVAEYKRGKEAADKLYFEEAAEYFGNAVELDPQFAVAYSRLSSALQNLGDEAKAREHQARALSLMKDERGKVRVTEKERLFIVIQDAYLQDDFAKARSAIDRWVHIYPKDYEAHAFLGMEHQRMEDHDEAILAYERTVKLQSDYAPAYNSLGYLYIAKGDFDRAMENLKKYKDMVPDQANPYDSMGELEQARGRYREAIKYYQKAREINPDLSFVLHHLGEVHRIQGQYARAIEYFIEAAEKAPGPEAEADSRLFLAYSYMRRGDLRQALTEAMRAMELNPRSPDAHFYLGLVHVARGDVKAAMTAAEQLDELLVRRNLKRYRMDRIWHHLMGEIHLARHDYQMAIESHQRAVDLTPNPLYRDFYLHALGNAYYRAGRLEEAISPLEKVLIQNHNHADCLYTLALIYKDKGEMRLAKECVSRFKKVFGDADEGVEWVEKVEKMKF